MVNSSAVKKGGISYAKYGYMFILPFFIVYIAFQVYPLINTFYLSTQSNGSVDTVFVGLDNFKAILFGQTSDSITQARVAGAANSDFKRVFGNTLILWFGNFFPQIALSLLLAAWYTNARLKIKGKAVYKVLMYLPNIITAASSAALFVMLFSETQFGAVNKLLMNMGLISDPIKFITGQTQSRVMIMIIQTWMWYGNTTIMLMSGIMGINGSLFEAASIDGATATEQFFLITIPLLKPIMIYTLVTSMIGGLQMFDMPALYRVGTTANKNIETVAVYIYGHFHSAVSPNYGYSAAASVCLFIVTSLLGIVCFIMNKDDKKPKVDKNRKLKKQLF